MADMFYTDYHLHSEFSEDCKTPMEDMARAAFERGASEICFTDHVDDCCGGDPIKFEIGDFFASRAGYLEEISRVAEAFRGRMAVKCGIELGGGNHDPELARRIAGTEGLDFVIGSVHNLRGMEDLYNLKYEDEAHCREVMKLYLLENMELAGCGCCDVIGHIGFAEKYMFERGFSAGVWDCRDELMALLRKAVENGVGIEINTSGFRRRIRDAAPSLKTVRLYRELGGEIITVGSDGHNVRQAGEDSYIEKGFQILREAGFEYLTVFRERKPEFIKI